MSRVVDHEGYSNDSLKVRPLPVETRQRPEPEPDGDTQAAIAKYVRIGLRYKWSILALALVGVIVGALKSVTAVPIYQAQATVAIGPDYSNAVPGQNLNLYYAVSWRFYETQYEMIQSHAVAERVVDKLGLVHRKNVNKSGEEKPGLIELITSSLGLEGLEIPGFKNKGETTAQVALDIKSPEQSERRKEALAAMIRNGVSVNSSEQSEIARVRFESPDPAFAAEVANAVVDAYIELGLEARLDRTKRTSAWLTERLEDLRNKVTESEDRLQAFQKQEGLVDSENMEQISSSKLQFLNDEVIRTQKAVSELSDRYGPKHPKMISAKAELESAQKRLEEASSNIVLEKSKQFELSKLERDVAANRQLYETFLAKFEETDMSAQYTITNAQIIDEARKPKSPVRPDKNKFVFQWGVIGLFCGVLLALFREQLHNTFRTNEDIEQKLALPVLGVVPMLGRRSAPKLKKKRQKLSESVPERHFLGDPKSAFSEAINHVRTGIAYSDVDSPPKTVLITSSVQGEGKTTLASNLALSFASLDRTLLIDADLRKPRVEQLTNAEASGGLVEYVAGLRTLQECIVQDPDCSTLDILKGGTIPPNPLELLSSKTLAKTVAELRNKYSHIVIDTAPILPVSDAIVLGHIVDSVLLVVQAERTTTKMARDALKRLENAGVRTMGVVLAQVHVRRSAYYYDGKYQYYYGGYYRSSNESSH